MWNCCLSRKVYFTMRRRNFKVRLMNTKLVQIWCRFQIHRSISCTLSDCISTYFPLICPCQVSWSSFCQGGSGWRRKFKFGRLSCLLPPGSRVSDLTSLFRAFGVQGQSLCVCERKTVIKTHFHSLSLFSSFFLFSRFNKLYFFLLISLLHEALAILSLSHSCQQSKLNWDKGSTEKRECCLSEISQN